MQLEYIVIGRLGLFENIIRDWNLIFVFYLIIKERGMILWEKDG